MHWLMRVLVVEDEVRLAGFLQKGLMEAGYAVDIAIDAENGDALLSENSYDIVLLDWFLPGKSGVELCREWRQRNIHVPILMVTARDNTREIIKALKYGADDFIQKPFSFEELLARMAAHLRRTRVFSALPKLTIDDLVVDVARREVRRGEEPIYLSAREFELLTYLMKNVGKVVSKTAITQEVWGFSFLTNTNLVEVYINHLRKKLNCGSKKPLIHTLRGMGYVLKVLDA